MGVLKKRMCNNLPRLTKTTGSVLIKLWPGLGFATDKDTLLHRDNKTAMALQTPKLQTGNLLVTSESAFVKGSNITRTQNYTEISFL